MKAVLFDLDETVLDRKQSIIDFAQWQAKGMLRREVVDSEMFCQRFVELDGNGGVLKNEVYRDLIREFDISDWSVEELFQSYDLCFSGFCKPKKGVIEAIKSLKNSGFKLGIISNGRSPFQERNFHALGVSNLFDSLVVSEAVGLRKPQKEIFEFACKKLEVSPLETIFVGDNPKADIDGANQCGMYTVFIPGYFGKTYEKANATCNDYSELERIVRNAT